MQARPVSTPRYSRLLRLQPPPGVRPLFEWFRSSVLPSFASAKRGASAIPTVNPTAVSRRTASWLAAGSPRLLLGVATLAAEREGVVTTTYGIWTGRHHSGRDFQGLLEVFPACNWGSAPRSSRRARLSCLALERGDVNLAHAGFVRTVSDPAAVGENWPGAVPASVASIGTLVALTCS